jgi:tRNA(fMet)-specific endonuclease VapC
MSLYVLDTDHVTLHQHNHRGVVARIQTVTPEELAITVITVEEQVRGRLAQLGNQGVNISSAYERLQATVNYFCDLNILPFDHLAQQQYQALRSQKIRVGTLDLRIASIVLRQDAILITRNKRDFVQIPGLKLQDWSAI